MWKCGHSVVPTCVQNGEEPIHSSTFVASLPFSLLLPQDEEDVSELCDGCDQEDDGPGVSLHSGLSTMRLILGANDRRIYAQRFGLAHYDMALQREQKRMVGTH